MGQHEEVEGFLIRCSMTMHAIERSDPFKPAPYYAYVDAMRYRITSRTSKGVWIEVGDKKRFVLNDARKRYAYPTYELALESFLIRAKHEQHHRKLRLAGLNQILTQPKERILKSIRTSSTYKPLLPAYHG